MTRRTTADLHRKWLANAERRGVPTAVTSVIADRHAVTRESFRVLEDMAEIGGPDGKSFFLIPPGSTGDQVRAATLMTYILNAGTGYGGPLTDFPETPYTADEVQRIIDRQAANSWSYDADVGFVDRNGGRLVTTPNGMLMGLGGNWIQRLFSRQGGTTWGDIFMVNVSIDNDPDGAARRLRQIVESGHAWYTDRTGRPRESMLALDRVLHHEELHSQQWAAKGHSRMITEYLWEVLRDRIFGKTNRLEAQAGLADGGYQ
ncbi:hypothetical protein [Mycobacterium genavense]|uniref:hypothetical protein n=1 Tax=Mycobacterium genavense TaxID=36812 RepID=UPI0004BA7627|nr:hypothetical protein [Mycobacterium genavense]